MLVLLLFSIFFNAILCQENNESCNVNTDPDFTKKNVVIFFTKPNIDLSEDVNDKGISFLKFPIKGQVKPSNNIPRAFENLFSIDSKSSNCDMVFNKYLLELMEWAENVKHMVTATVSTSETKVTSSVENKFISPSSKLQGIEIYRYSIQKPQDIFNEKDTKNQDESDSFGNPFQIFKDFDIFGRPPLRRVTKDTKSLPQLKFRNYYRDFPVIEAFNPAETLDEDNSLFDKDEQVLKLLGEDSGTCKAIPANENKNIESNEIPNDFKLSKLSPEQENLIETNTNDIITAFDVFSRIRDLFLGNFFNSHKKSRSLFQEENRVDPSVLGQIETKPLFDLVRITLENLKQQAEVGRNCNGFLMVVLGGDLSEIANPFSDLVQSVKYVLEHTKEYETLVLVSCQCPKTSCVKRRIPYYAQGINSEELKNAESMSDIFENVRNAIRWSKNRSGKNKYPIKQNMESKPNGNLYEFDDDDKHVLVGGGRLARAASSAQSICINVIFIVIAPFGLLLYHQNL